MAWVKCVLMLTAMAVSTMASVMLDMPPRYMWGWEPKVSGYCGSVSVQTTALYFGNWVTEDFIRGTSGGHNGNHQLLILYPKDAPTKGVAISHACEALSLDYTMWNYNKASSPQHTAFIRWAKSALDAKKPVIFGVYWGVESDADYDHIVPMIGYDDESIYYNDLHGNFTRRANLSSFVRTRKQCHDQGAGRAAGDRYKTFCLPRTTDYGVIVNGNMDTNSVLLPVRMSVSSWTEPDYSKEDQQQQQSVRLTANVTVSGLTVGSCYALLRYDKAANVPAADFIKSAYDRKVEYVATAGTYMHATSFMSNATVFFRAVAIAGEH